MTDLMRVLHSLGPVDSSDPQALRQRQEAMARVYDALSEYARRDVPRLPSWATDNLDGFRRSICAETFLRQVETIERWIMSGREDELPTSDGGVRCWLWKSLRWTICKHYREAQRRQGIPLDDDDSESAFTLDSLHHELWIRALRDGIVDPITEQPASTEALDQTLKGVVNLFKRIGNTMAILQKRVDGRESTMRCVNAYLGLIQADATPNDVYKAFGREENTVQKLMQRFRGHLLDFLELYEKLPDSDLQLVPTSQLESLIQHYEQQGIRGARLLFGRRISAESTPADVHHLLDDFLYPDEITNEDYVHVRALLNWLKQGDLMRRKRPSEIRS